MAIENEEVKEFVEKVSIEGKPGEKEDDDETIEPAESSTAEPSDEEKAESEDDTDTTKKDELVKKPAETEIKKPEEEELAEIEGETPRERALRLEVTRLRRIGRDGRKEELGIKSPTGQPEKKELSPEKKKVLERYKPEDIQNLKEVFDVMADDMGFVRKDQLGATTYTERASDELEKFIDAHSEYLPENDPDNVLWDRFKEEYALYKQPDNPKDFKRIFEKVHRDVFGIKPAGDNKNINAAKEKIKVASHSGASKPNTPVNKAKAPAGIRFDMLKGFSDEERAELENSTGD